MLKQLLANAQKNASRLPRQRHHGQVLKKFATALFIYSGPLAYEFLQKKLPEALPSLRTIQRIVSSEFLSFNEGEFRFEELVAHLDRYGLPKIVSIGEDATRVISRVEYDSNTDRLVGFVLPLNKEGIPLTDSFLATSFESIEDAFAKGTKAKYAFTYMIQPLQEGAPSFCLACIGTDNKFDTAVVFNRWSHIFKDCKKRGISVVSFGADGDTREMKAMQVSCQLLLATKPSLFSLSPTHNLATLTILLKWKTWIAIQHPTTISCVQDTVHIAVKLKARLLQPSIVLPLVSYLAGSHHLHFIQNTFGKDQHGLREKDTDHKDRQNFDAAMHVTSESVLELLSQIPDAKGTKACLEVMRAVIDSYLDKSLSVLSRLEKAWFAVFLMRYWRKWVLLHPQYDLGKNFITSNAYMCIELNAHALITKLLTIRQTLPPDRQCFLPWLLGTQSCEKIFRAARSMTSTFSTMINFGMLGLMRRLHCLHIQLCFEAEADENHICYPRNKIHQAKGGQNQSSKTSVSSVTDKEISDAVTRGKVKAQSLIKDLGMAELLIKGKCWENPPATGVKCEVEDENDDDDCDYYDDDKEDESQQQCGDKLVTEDVSPQDVNVEISQLKNAGILEDELKYRLHELSLKRLPNRSLRKGINRSSFSSEKKKDYATAPTESKPKAQLIQPTVQQSLEVGDLCVLARAGGGILAECYNLLTIWKKEGIKDVPWKGMLHQ